MANLMDYLLWRGDLSLLASPWNDVDSLMMAMLCYNPLSVGQAAEREGITLAEMAPGLDLMERTGNIYFQQWRELLYAAAKTRRYGGMIIHDYEDLHDEDVGMQFSAIAADLEDGTTFVAYRGTDNSIIGWHEDFDMSYESPVPAQSEAVAYLERIAAASHRLLRLSGHSKGGNLAVYAGACASDAVQKRIMTVCSFDGPGLDETVLKSEGYAAIKSRLLSVIPQSSIVGMLLGYHTDYTVVHSSNLGIWQHDAMSWQLDGPAFQAEKEIDAHSTILSDALHAWLKGCSCEERHTIVEALFTVLQATDARTTDEIAEKRLQSTAAMITALRRMDPETKRTFIDILKRMVGETSNAALEYLTAWAEERA